MAAPNILNASIITGKQYGAALDTSTTTSLVANAASSDDLYKINSIICANVDGASSVDVTISWYDGSTDRHLAKEVALPAKSTLVVLGKDAPIYLEEGHSIRGGASANSDAEVLICYEILDDA